jgi:glycerophosphoryl diester phosphodiesterase
LRRKWLLVPLVLIAVGAASYGVMVLTARPASDHAFFAGENPQPEVIAHRGGSQLRPENTLEAFSHAVEIGADVLDMDARRTADGAIVCIHDPSVDRTTEGSGSVASLRLDELQRLDAGYRWSNDGGQTFPFRGKGIRVPSLDEVFTRFPATRMVIEMKDTDPTLAQSLCALIRRFGRSAKTLVASFRADALTEFRAACPEVATSMSGPEARAFISFSRAYLSAVYSPPVPALQVPDRLRESVLATAQLIEDARRRGLKVHVWTINEEQRMRELIRLGVDGIITDRPDRLLELRRRERPRSH